MDKKKLKYTVNKAKEESTMEKTMNQKSKSILEILPLELIHRILLRVPIRYLARLRCVSKLWYFLISDPDFAELHFHRSPASTNACISIGKRPKAYSVYLDALFSDGNDTLQVRKEVSPLFKKKPPSHLRSWDSAEALFSYIEHPHFLVLWNLLTGFGKRISYFHIVRRCKYHSFRLPYSVRLHGFGYDASQDDYLFVVAWSDWERRYHLDCLSLRTNSWINLDAVLPSPLNWFDHNSCGLCLNGAIHWMPSCLTTYRDAILIFDLKEKTFSRISGPEQPVIRVYSYSNLALLGGCLALYYHNYDSCNTHIWVMKEYKVHSSWTLYQIPCIDFRPLCLSSNGDIIGRGYISNDKVGYFIYNVRRDLLKHFKNFCCPIRGVDVVYTESLLPLPSHIKTRTRRIRGRKL
ncbi:F-box/kelch-repeat protein At3g06240-like [Arachis duranensis]|uniref:F-box/kelch-repeat protein At3g06240-like n=1 Tax=Arachis duranensis TaxID=130453 RepID=A0A9C6WV77_ARADU|nr:F-box/kelch-repeat protein At3g06240-like [Arachis duranensis]